jgi:hypothetical protein
MRITENALAIIYLRSRLDDKCKSGTKYWIWHTPVIHSPMSAGKSGTSRSKILIAGLRHLANSWNRDEAGFSPVPIDNGLGISCET